MFISLLFAACSPSLTRRSTNVGPRALRNDGVERVGKHAAWAAIQAAYVGEVPGIPQILFHEPHVAPVVQTVPDLDRLRGKATIFTDSQTTNRPMVCFYLHVPQEGAGYALEFTNEGR
jgi:hypothetical protein